MGIGRSKVDHGRLSEMVSRQHGEGADGGQHADDQHVP
jgi:hypothetical protein